MTLERVDTLIERVMDEYPVTPITKAAGQLRYYEAVHQELAPLARALEIENAQLQETIRGYQRKEFEQQRVTVTHVWSCGKCGNVYRGGQKEVTVFAENGRVYCRTCVKPARVWACAPMVETTEPRS